MSQPLAMDTGKYFAAILDTCFAPSKVDFIFSY